MGRSSASLNILACASDHLNPKGIDVDGFDSSFEPLFILLLVLTFNHTISGAWSERWLGSPTEK